MAGNNEVCPVASLLKIISKAWVGVILWHLRSNKQLRFGEMGRLIDGISPKMLTDRLRLLESVGIVNRSYKPTIPPEVSYSLTDMGQDIAEAMGELDKVAQKWNFTCKS